MKLTIVALFVTILGCVVALVWARYQTDPMNLSVNPPVIPSVEYGSYNVCLGRACMQNIETGETTYVGMPITATPIKVSTNKVKESN